MMKKNIVFEKHRAWQERLEWEKRAKDNFDSQNPHMMFANTTTNSFGQSFDSRAKRSQSVVRMKKQWERPKEPVIKAELVYSPLNVAWVYREPKTRVNQDYYH